MGYSHYLKADSSLSAEECKSVMDACCAFIDRMAQDDLEACLEHPAPDPDFWNQANSLLLARNMDGFRAHCEMRGGFACLPAGAEEFCVEPSATFISCKTSGFGSMEEMEAFDPKKAGAGNALTVCLCIAAQEALRDGTDFGLRFESDGFLDDLDEARRLWKRTMGHPAPDLPFIEESRPGQRIDLCLERGGAVADHIDQLMEGAQLLWEACAYPSDGAPFSLLPKAEKDLGFTELRTAMRDPKLVLPFLQVRDEAAELEIYDAECAEKFIETCVEDGRATLRHDWQERWTKAMDEIREQQDEMPAP